MSIRKITFGGFDSLGAGLRINSERSSTSGGEQRVSSDTIAYRDGDIRYPTGQETARLTYCFVLREGSRAANEAKAKAVINALKGRRGDLADSDIPGKVYKNAIYESAEPLEYVSRSFATAYMTVVFTADPEPEPAGAVNECVLRFAVRGNANIAFVSYQVEGETVYRMVVTAGGATLVSEVVELSEPFVFRLEAISENEATAQISGQDIPIGTPFDMLPSTVISIQHSGYGWYELWHDTREVIP